MQRTVSAPDWEYGTEEQAFQWLGIARHVWKGLRESGEIPPPATWSRETEYWPWDAVMAIGRLLPFLIEKAVKAKLGKKPAGTAGEPDGTAAEPERTRRAGREA